MYNNRPKEKLRIILHLEEISYGYIGLKLNFFDWSCDDVCEKFVS
jgi:hypothetical protein